MAGIGFELKKLAGRRGMLAPVASLGHATVVAAGPWLLTVIALSLIQSRVTMETEWRSSSVQALIIYCFCLSLVATAPITAVAVRIASDQLYLKHFHKLVPIFLVATLASVASGLGLALLVFASLLNLPFKDLSLAAVSCGIVSAMWPAMAFCGMVRRYGAISRAFIFGLATSVALTFAAEQFEMSATVEAMAFAAGLGLTTIFLQATFLGTFASAPAGDHKTPLAATQDTSSYGWVALGALFSALALWADTWVMWLGPLQVISSEGLATAPFYDSVMFLARISMVPALAFFIIWVETAVFDRVLAYIAAIRGTGTLERILKEATGLRATIRQMLTSVLLVQLVASCALALLAHTAIDASGLLFQQTGLLRNGAIGALFHVIFLAATTILLFLDRVRAFALLQGLFLALNASLTLAVSHFLPDAPGLGYVIAAALGAIVAVLVLEETSEDIVALTFAAAHRRVSAAGRSSPSPLSAALGPGLARVLGRIRTGKQPLSQGSASTPQNPRKGGSS